MAPIVRQGFGSVRISKLFEFEILNEGNEPTICNNRILEVIDISLGSFGLLESIKPWKVYSECFLSDNRHLLANLIGSLTERLIRNPRDNNWDAFRENMKGKMGKGPLMNMKDETRLGHTIIFVLQVLMSSYKENCPLKYVRSVTYSLRCTHILHSPRKEARPFFSKN